MFYVIFYVMVMVYIRLYFTTPFLMFVFSGCSKFQALFSAVQSVLTHYCTCHERDLCRAVFRLCGPALDNSVHVATS
jgi:hypothetical protein